MVAVGAQVVAAQEGLSDRGLAFQAFGFGVVGCVSVWILEGCAAHGCEACSVFEQATRLHWAFVVPLAWFFDKVRRMFERASAIRRKRVQEEIEKLVEGLDPSRLKTLDPSDPNKVKIQLKKLLEEQERQRRPWERLQ